jgi:hypothetical protein
MSGRLPVFDPDRPYGEVYGTNTVRFYQDGIYFTGDKRPCRNIGPDQYEVMDGAVAPQPSARGQAQAEAASAVTQSDAELAATRAENEQLKARLAAFEVKAEGGPVMLGTAKPKDPAPQTGGDPKAEQRTALEGMAYAKIKSIFLKAGGPEEMTGQGGKPKMVDWLIENTE